MQFVRIDQMTTRYGLIVNYEEVKDWGRIWITREGITLGPLLPKLKDNNRSTFEAVLSRAFEQYQSLRSRKKIALPFEGDPECVTEYYIWDSQLHDRVLLGQR
jgi:hypothetical protein